MTGDEVRALCLSLPETTEKETWGDDENAGPPDVPGQATRSS